MKYLITLLLVLTSFSHSLLADSPVWKISRDNHHLYIGGTIHLLGANDYPLPAGFDQAYQKSQKIVFETDIQKIKSLEFAQTLMGQAMYPPGTSLKTVLNPSNFAALKKYLGSRGIPIEQMMNLKIGMVIVSLTAIELQRLGVGGAGADEFMNQKALTDKKQMGYLESPSQQIAYISEMGKGMEDKVVEHTLRDLKILPETLKELKSAWRKGDRKKLNEIGIIPFKKDYPKVYEAILVQRNQNWIGSIESMLRNDEVELVLVGALHLVGKEGILVQLQELGYQIEKL